MVRDTGTAAHCDADAVAVKVCLRNKASCFPHQCWAEKIE